MPSWINGAGIHIACFCVDSLYLSVVGENQTTIRSTIVEQLVLGVIWLSGVAVDTFLAAEARILMSSVIGENTSLFARLQIILIKD